MARDASKLGLASLAAVAVVAAVAWTPALGCHVSGCRESDQACLMQAESSEAGETTDSDTSADTAGPDASSSDTSSGPTTTESSTTEEQPAVCGDGVVGGDEACDDGNDATDDACMPDCTFATCGDGFVHVGSEECDDANADDADDCTSKCTLPRCGDGLLHPSTETCDLGKLNSDKIYGGCGSQCQMGPGCGDGEVNGPEDCDDGNDDSTDGCLAGCVESRSCKQILETVPGLPSGQYRVWPEALGGNIDVRVHCDMVADGGGYTYLKVDTEAANVSDKGAVAAEAICKSYGMHLLAPRTPEHVKSAHAFAVAENLTPVGGGKTGAGAEYMSILAIYPSMKGATCDGKGLNSMDCPLWQAWDMQRFWVTATPVLDEPSSEHCLECSMFYKWNLDGTLKSYTTFPIGEGASSYRFICDVGDKF